MWIIASQFHMSTAHRVEKSEITLGSQVRVWRIHLNLTQGELESAAGLAHNAVSRIETEDVSPRLETVEKLAAAMEISIEQLQFGNPQRASAGDVGKDPDAEMARLLKRLKRLHKKDAARAVIAIEAILDLME